MMDGVHDIGGRQGFGPIAVDENEEPFHAPWEGRMLGIARGMRCSAPAPLPLPQPTILRSRSLISRGSLRLTSPRQMRAASRPLNDRIMQSSIR